MHKISSFVILVNLILAATGFGVLGRVEDD